MGIKTILNKKTVLPNYDFSVKYWPIVTQEVEKEIGTLEIKESTIVQGLLKKCFSKLCKLF